MLKKSSIGLRPARMAYEVLKAVPLGPLKIAEAPKVTLLVDAPMDGGDILALKVGDEVRTGQKLVPFALKPAYGIAPMSGKICALEPFAGDMGRTYTAITIEAGEDQLWDDGFDRGAEDASLEHLLDYLACAPGSLPIEALQTDRERFHTLVVMGMDSDLLVATNQYIVQARMDDITAGIAVLKRITGVDRVLVVVPRDLVQGFGHIGAEIRALDRSYPTALPPLAMQALLGTALPVGKRPEDLGVCFFSAEAVASVGKAYGQKRQPLEKTLTLIDKDGRRQLITALVGTPVGEILKAAGIAMAERDRLVVGGPLRGTAIYTQEHPVGADTDALMVQRHEDIAPVSDYPCINCGECIRACPANIPVNMLVRFLEARQYDTAADEYDLHCCVECGLCSFVCVARIPIFQYIRLAKFELAKIQQAEATEDE